MCSRGANGPRGGEYDGRDYATVLLEKYNSSPRGTGYHRTKIEFLKDTAADISLRIAREFQRQPYDMIYLSDVVGYANDLISVCKKIDDIARQEARDALAKAEGV